MKVILLVVAYHPMFKSQDKILHNNIHLLNMNEEMRKDVTLVTMISITTPRKTSSYLIRAIL